MSTDECHAKKYGFAFDNMTMVTSSGSIWDYMYVPLVMNTMYGIVVEPQRSPFPSRSRIPQVDPPSRFEPNKMMEMRHHTGETELGEVQVIATIPTNNVTTSTLPLTTTTSPHSGELSCRNGGCKARRSRAEPRLESPWHTLKTIFLVSVIVAFLLWVIVYTLLDQYQIL